MKSGARDVAWLTMPKIAEAIADAERVLARNTKHDDGVDPRWQAIIRVAEFIPDEVDLVWAFAEKWGGVCDPDLQAAVATCLLEHLMEHHFDYIFPMVAVQAKRDAIFASTLRRCWKFGQAERTESSAALDELLNELGRPNSG